MTSRERKSAFKKAVLAEVVEFLRSIECAPLSGTELSREAMELKLTDDELDEVLDEMIVEMDDRAGGRKPLHRRT